MNLEIRKKKWLYREISLIEDYCKKHNIEDNIRLKIIQHLKTHRKLGIPARINAAVATYLVFALSGSRKSYVHICKNFKVSADTLRIHTKQFLFNDRK